MVCTPKFVPRLNVQLVAYTLALLLKTRPLLPALGVAGWMIRQAALWSREHGATRLGLAVSRANVAARATWDRLGLAEVAGYSYYLREL